MGKDKVQERASKSFCIPFALPSHVARLFPPAVPSRRNKRSPKSRRGGRGPKLPPEMSMSGKLAPEGRIKMINQIREFVEGALRERRRGKKGGSSSSGGAAEGTGATLAGISVSSKGLVASSDGGVPAAGGKVERSKSGRGGGTLRSKGGANSKLKKAPPKGAKRRKTKKSPPKKRKKT